jgi:hypothetical protein
MRIIGPAAVLAAGLTLVQAAQAASAEKGKAAYVQHGCWQCHGFQGQGASTGAKRGAERMIDPHVILGLEYLYYGLDNVALTGPISPGSFLPVTFTWSNYSVQVVRASLSYKF